MFKHNFWEKGFILAHYSRLRVSLAGKSQQQKHEAAGHTMFSVGRQQWLHACSLGLSSLSPLLGSPGSLLREQCHPQWEDLPASINVINIASHRHTWRPGPLVILGFQADNSGIQQISCEVSFFTVSATASILVILKINVSPAGGSVVLRVPPDYKVVALHLLFREYVSE